MTSRQILKRRAKRAGELLCSEYGRPSYDARRDGRDPLDQLVSTVLSQKTTSEACRRAFERIKQTAPRWDDVLSMPRRRLAALIRDAGLADQKSRRIREILRRLRADSGAANLDWLWDAETEEAERYLLSLPGVGPKTAKCVLMFCLGREVLPVDTHVHRIARRLQLIGEDVTAQKAHAVLEPLVAPPDRYSFHVNLFRHGRTVCLSQRPRCRACCLRRICPTGRRYN